jgi:hypothetical protein
MGKMKARWEELSFDDSLNDYLYYIYTQEQKQKEKSSERAKIRKISTRRCVDAKNK